VVYRAPRSETKPQLQLDDPPPEDCLVQEEGGVPRLYVLRKSMRRRFNAEQDEAPPPRRIARPWDWLRKLIDLATRWRHGR